MKQRHLDPDGNCLGVVVKNVLQRHNFEEETDVLADLYSVRDCVNILRKFSLEPVFMCRHGASIWEKITISFMASFRFNTRAVKKPNRFRSGTIICCLRTVHQLYDIDSANLHWVALICHENDFEFYDPLFDTVIKGDYSEFRVSSVDLLAQVGVNIIIGL